MRVICVMGRRFSGSTILGRILDASPDIQCVGETLPIRQGYANCATCGGRCRCVDYGRLRHVPAARFYRELYKESGHCVLATTDKPFRYVKALTQPQGFEAIFVFKSPFAFAASEKRGHPRHRRHDGTLVFQPLSVGEALQGVCEYYEKALKWRRPAVKHFVSIEHLAIDYPEATRRLFEALGVKHPQGVIDVSKLEHHFAIGNFDAMDSRQFQPDCRWVSELTDAEKQEVAEHKGVQSVYRRLLTKSIV